jgi:hypothetical protein
MDFLLSNDGQIAEINGEGYEKKGHRRTFWIFNHTIARLGSPSAVFLKDMGLFSNLQLKCCSSSRHLAAYNNNYILLLL